MAGQKLNSLDRFRKRSPRLLLEQHSHCEVPAGCGGVALRWRNPHEARPLRVHLYTTAPAVALLDGREQTLGRLEVRPGRHALALDFGRVRYVTGILMAVLQHDPGETPLNKPPPVREPPVRVVSAADGTWKYTLTQPPEGWAAPDFDDSGWAAMVERPIPEVDWNQPGGYQWQACNREKAHGLGVPQASTSPRSGPVWVRRVFDVPPPVA